MAVHHPFGLRLDRGENVFHLLVGPITLALGMRRDCARSGGRHDAALACVAVLAALAVVKTFERGSPPVAVRAAIAVFVVGPLAGLAYAMWALWQRALQPVDLAAAGVFAVVTGLGTSLGYHRLLTHRSFRTTPWIAGHALAAGAMAVPSRPIDWAARHLEHHAHADREGDPHSPVDGLLHAHVGWMFGGQPGQARALLPPADARPRGDADRAHGGAVARAGAGGAGTGRRLAGAALGRHRADGHPQPRHVRASTRSATRSARSRSQPATRAATTA